MLALKCNSTPFYLAVVTFLQSELQLVTGNGGLLPGLLNNYVAIAVANLLAKLKKQSVVWICINWGCFCLFRSNFNCSAAQQLKLPRSQHCQQGSVFVGVCNTCRLYLPCFFVVLWDFFLSFTALPVLWKLFQSLSICWEKGQEGNQRGAEP